MKTRARVVSVTVASLYIAVSGTANAVNLSRPNVRCDEKWGR
jgi:hypothetical protein